MNFHDGFKAIHVGAAPRRNLCSQTLLSQPQFPWQHEHLWHHVISLIWRPTQLENTKNKVSFSQAEASQQVFQNLLPALVQEWQGREWEHVPKKRQSRTLPRGNSPHLSCLEGTVELLTKEKEEKSCLLEAENSLLVCPRNSTGHLINDDQASPTRHSHKPAKNYFQHLRGFV